MITEKSVMLILRGYIKSTPGRIPDNASINGENLKWKKISNQENFTSSSISSYTKMVCTNIRTFLKTLASHQIYFLWVTMLAWLLI